MRFAIVIFLVALGGHVSSEESEEKKKETEKSLSRKRIRPRPPRLNTTAAATNLTRADEPKFELKDVQTADLVFLVDVTGSMGAYIHGVKEAIQEIVDNANKAEILLRLAFVGYRDPFGAGRIPEDLSDEGLRSQFEVLPFVEKVSEFKTFVSGVAARGGGDGPEDVFGGLEKAGRLLWNPSAAKRVLFHIADAPAHGSRYGGSDRFDTASGDPLNRNLTQLLEVLKEAKVEYKFGFVSSWTDKMVTEFGLVWGEEIPKFPVAASQPRPSSSMRGMRPSGARGAGGRLSRRLKVKSRRRGHGFMGPAPAPSSAAAGAALPSAPAESVKGKLVSAFSSIFTKSE